MNNRLMELGAAVAASLLSATFADASIYRVLPSETDVLPGATTTLSVEVETEVGDNALGIGYFSFAIDLTLTGTAGATGSDVSNILINETDFDDLSNISFGLPQGDQYLGVAGVTTDIFPPTFGETAGDITWLFDFELMISAMAEPGDTIMIMPGEGALESLIANGSFDNVAPQTFQPATMTVVPEPTTAALLVTVLALRTVFFPRRRIRSDGR